ncbi:MAG TPA: HupE/UreJ family protein [Burkholderiales bacterium]|nr:HupE/UreJ family protein [Burkholderiales bacterium]
MRLLALLLALVAAPAAAHKSSDSYLALKVDGAQIEGQWDIALRDLDFAVGLDANADGEITWGEVKARQPDIAAYALARLALRSETTACPARATGHLLDDHSDGAYAVLRFEATCPDAIADLEVDYSLLFDLDPQHRGLLRLEHAAATRTAVFGPERGTQRFAVAELSWWRQLRDYGREGVWHIWVGFDHILFLLSLLLPAVLKYANGRWEAVDAFAPAVWDVFKIVTAFTVAHSITLGLATLDVVTLPSRLVESAIAASVVLAALNNLFPVVRRGRWAVAFLFGLVHGFGFAAVLRDLALPQGALALALVGFNLGVEVGQLAMVAVFLPVAFLLARTALYRRVILVGGSALIVLVAWIWLTERALDVRLL